jgi:protein-glucosylgalactosylhydroxylysine glucosidase
MSLRRFALATCVAGAPALFGGPLLTAAIPAAPARPRIDRQSLVSRHDPVLRTLDAEAPLSVGNGTFAFTADVTGLQTFTEPYEKTIPLATLSHWGWHTAPNPRGFSMDRFVHAPFESHGRAVGYADIPGDRRTPEVAWLRANPHRLHLGRISFRLTREDGSPGTRDDLSDVEQTLRLWDGVLVSRFRFEGELVEVETLVHPRRDLVAIRVASALLAQRRLAVRLAFPYGTGEATAADWTRPEAHTTVLRQEGARTARLERRLDAESYAVAVAWHADGSIREIARHEYEMAPQGESATWEVVVEFGAQALAPSLSFATARDDTHAHWHRFWSDGGAVDLSASRDSRWRELERRIVLSQYLTAIQCAGDLPPAETGLTFNSWEGKFHLEMHWWHAAQFALWGRLPLLEKSLGYYETILPRARETARRQGYTGARWPKMTGPTGIESPSTIGPFLIWQQPHPIFYAELVYREKPERAVLERFREVVSESAEFMASFAARDEPGKRFVLGPPLHCAQEVFPRERTQNCTYELVYWRWGLETAQKWRERLGLTRDARWDAVLLGLARPALADGRYVFAETAPDSYADPRWSRDHPAVTGALGVLPGPGVDPEAMRRTLDWIWEKWRWADTWGWDYPLVAMTAARLGQPARAVDALLLDTPKNHYRRNGHNHQRPGLTIYLPGNGGLLYAVALMAAGWDGGPERAAPGFPDDGSWTVRAEGLRRAP